MYEQQFFQGDLALMDYMDYVLSNTKKLMIVSGKNCIKLPLMMIIDTKVKDKVYFDEFEPNPKYESIKRGVSLFRASGCDALLAAGGGSAIDVAKCIKLFATMDEEKNFLLQEYKDNDIGLFAIPTTAGTGSESTRFAVIYYQGEKQSIAHDSILPRGVLLAPKLIESVPPYQRKATMLDAFCHAIESFWSINSSKRSREYSLEAISIIRKTMPMYLENEAQGNEQMLKASNLAGQAINITQTTAAHAMCYKLTSLYGLAHGHSVAIVLPELWRFMIKHMEQCIDRRGSNFLKDTFEQLAECMGCVDAMEAVEKVEQLISGLELGRPMAQKEDISKLVSSVNTVRLKNNPVELSKEDIELIYNNILL